MKELINTNIGEDIEIISENEKWFKFFVILPKAITIFFAIACFILGIIFGESTDGISLLICWFGGAILCALNYVILKIVLSYQILHIYYLKKSAFNNTLQLAESKNTDVLPDI